MKKEHKFKFEDKVFLFILEDKFPGGNQEINGYPYISCLLFRKDLPEFEWSWNGILKPLPEKIEFHLVYEDQINIKGYIHLFESQGQNKEDYIFMDTQYGIQYEEHFEGNVFEIGAVNHISPQDPIIPISDSDSTAILPVEFISGDGFKDLFPYLYLQFWPKVLSDKEIFLINIPNNLNSYPFYGTLLKLITSKTPRVSIEEESLKFINGEAPYSSEFIQNVEELPFPFPLFVEIYDDLYRGEPVVVEELLDKVRIADSNNKKDKDPIKSYLEEIQRIWGNIIALTIIEGYQVNTFEQLSKLLVINNLLDYLQEFDNLISEEEIKQLLHASIILSKPLFPLPAFEGDPTENEIYNGTITPYAIGDLQMVQHQIKGYQLGDLARIENVMAGELKKSRHRKRAISSHDETYSKLDKIENKNKEKSDALERNVTKVIADSFKDTFTYNDLKVSYGPPTSGIYNGSANQDKSQTTTTTGPTEFAKHILTNTVNQIDHQINTRRHNILRNETDDSISNIIENRQNNKNLRGIFYWLNKVYQLRLINYGHRFLIEFVVEKPAIKQMNSEASPIPIPPIAPVLLPNHPIKSFQDINLDNYLDLAQIYNIDDLPFPPAVNKISTAQIKGDQLTSYTEMKVPEGYLPKLLVINYNIENKATLIAGDKKRKLKPGGDNKSISDPLQSLIPINQETAYIENLVLPVALNTAPKNVDSQLFTPYFVNLILTSKVSIELMNHWKQEVYQAIQKAYKEQIKLYRQRMDEQLEDNPAFANQIIEKLMKSACSQLLWQQHVNINGTPNFSILPTENNINKPAFFQFFESAFEWDKMVITLDQNLTSNKKADLINEYYNVKYDNKIEEFLQAEEARVIVPLHSNYNYKMLYYLSAGQIFYGDDHLTPVLSSNEAIAIKIKEIFEFSPEYKIQELECWDQEVPTEMQWLTEDGRVNIFCK